MLFLTAERLQLFKLLLFFGVYLKEALTINLIAVNYREFSHFRNIIYSKIFRNIMH